MFLDTGILPILSPHVACNLRCLCHCLAVLLPNIPALIQVMLVYDRNSPDPWLDDLHMTLVAEALKAEGQVI